MKQKGFKVNENIFNSLIIGHSQSGDMARAHGMLKVPPTSYFYCALSDTAPLPPPIFLWWIFSLYLERWRIYVSRGPPFGDFVTVRTEASMQDITIASKTT
jgi:hypothetical protein